ncbi:MAG: cation transporter [Actinophytocola sp.]|uniref:cation diffusion facilitator family transporter n=1 Tax=Actinophytocola sp. TaxID=1872138 RepID=UPI003C70EF70
MNARAGTREQSALRLSIVVSAVMTVVAVAWGLASGSRVVLFDGVYILIGTALSGLGLAAARAVEAGASRRFPFGREALTPLVIGVQGLALLGTCAYAVLDSIRVIASGGVDVAPGAVAGYAVVSAVVSWGFAVHLRKGDHASELLDAEARQWMAGAVLSLVVGVGAVAALVLQRTAWSGVEAYVDPVLVIVACVLIAPHPVRMVRTMMTELLEGAPPVPVQEPVRAAVAAVRAEHGLGEPDVRVGKVGRKLYVEVDFVVRPGEWDVADEDRVRRAVAERLSHLPYDVWLNVELTTDAQLLA